MKSVLARLVLIIAIAASVAIAGCGQRGNLYLPNQKKKVPTTQTPPTPDTPSGAK